jgi:hypothetical protein
MTTTALRFTGEIDAWLVIVLATTLAALMAWLYSREVRRSRPGRWAWTLVALRSAVVFLAVLTLAGPVLRQTTVERKLGRVVLALDASASMRLTDDEPDGGGDPRTRWERAQDLLLKGSQPLLQALAAEHDVELAALRGTQSQRIWWRRQGGRDTSGPLPAQLPVSADAPLTDLGGAPRQAAEPLEAGTALVMLTDGQHNADGEPEEMAAALKAAGVPVYALGFGAEVPPPDLSVALFEIPESAYAREQLRGAVTIGDSMPPGVPARVVVESGGRELWGLDFSSDGKGERRLEFQFAVADIPETAKGAPRLLTARVNASGPEAAREKTRANNSAEAPLQVLERKRRVLILDGRPRWESRYIHNHFDRDERWEARVAFDSFTDNPAEGDLARTFPATRDELFTFDLVILGDMRPDRLLDRQLGWLLEFVEKRGGGLIWIDGQRGHLRSWLAAGEASRLLPVSWEGGGLSSAAGHTWSTDTDNPTPSALLLASSRSANAELWPRLPPALWTARVKPEPGAQVVARLDGSGSLPAMVFRPTGAGAVLYLSTDELWRWRYQVADLYHQRLWMQIAAWIAAPPFQVETPRLSIGSDRLRYRVGDQAEIRVRLRGSDGSLITAAKPRAILLRGGEPQGMVELAPDEDHAGVYRGLTPRLKAGDFEVAIEESAGASPAASRLAIRASDQEDRELAQLTLNAPLLQSLAQTTGGQFLRESQAAELPALLRQVDRRQTIVRELILWSSWWWFGALITLLTAEWLLRKRFKLI